VVERIKTISSGLIRVLMDVALYRSPLAAEGQRVMTAHDIHEVIDDPRGTSCDIAARRARLVPELRKSISEVKPRQGVCPGRPGYLGQLADKIQVYGTITLIPVQVSDSNMVGHR
jgi:hypothetical protein